MLDKVRVYININFKSERQILQLQSFAEQILGENSITHNNYHKITQKIVKKKENFPR